MSRHSTSLAVCLEDAWHSCSEPPLGTVFLNQVHSTDILINPASGETGDGMILARPGVLPGLRVADCLPVFAVWDHWTGAAHAGWRGLAGGIIEKLLQSVNSPLRGFVLGPCICADCYSVGQEVRCAVGRTDPSGSSGHPPGRVDLRGSALRRAAPYLNNEVEVIDIDRCTLESNDLFSFRRNATESRNLIWLAEIPAGEHIHWPFHTVTNDPLRGE